jgi:uncharacterized cupin superfamily protein
MVEERGGWFVVNVRDARWRSHPNFGRRCSFEMKEPFPQTGVGLAVLEPGKPNCRYHRESVQEDFLVLSGECLLLVNGEEKTLGPWDYFHCPPGVSHVFVGSGNGTCVVLMIGRRGKEKQLYYPASDLARRYGAETREPTPEPRVAYSDLKRWEEAPAPEWPLAQDRP